VASSRENPALARVTWASSLAVELQSPKPGGIAFVSPSTSGGPATPRQDFSQQTLYAQTKAGNSHLAAVLARRDRSDKILHLAFNPGNLNTDLLRHLPAALAWVLRTMVLYPARFGAYTELWALLGEVGIEASGSYVAPWGRVERMNREDLRTALEDGSESGVGARFLGWVERETEKFS
jgi:NAD(P)-dependent dehydrogenase (short-subunit alcohol dehydrogenase family)